MCCSAPGNTRWRNWRTQDSVKIPDWKRFRILVTNWCHLQVQELPQNQHQACHEHCNHNEKFAHAQILFRQWPAVCEAFLSWRALIEIQITPSSTPCRFYEFKQLSGWYSRNSRRYYTNKCTTCRFCEFKQHILLAQQVSLLGSNNVKQYWKWSWGSSGCCSHEFNDREWMGKIDYHRSLPPMLYFSQRLW